MPVNYLFAQKDSTIRQLKEVNIRGINDHAIMQSPAAVQLISRKTLETLPALQLSDALKYLAGVTIKDYGGAGGLKTVSVRGLGTQHTGVAYDLIALSDCQTGQIDLGKLSMENVENIRLVTGPSEDLLWPARLFSFSNLLIINTHIPDFDKTLHVKAAVTFGDYGLVSPSIFCENLLKSKYHSDSFVSWNIFANYLHSNGNYPYTLHYGGLADSISHERRQNSDVTSCNAEANVRWVMDHTQFLTFKWYYYDSERGLPSATVFYNLNSSQRLWNRNTFGQLSYNHHFTKWTYLVNTKFNYDFTHYLDPDYLNAVGFLDNQYRQYEGYLSNTLRFMPFEGDTGRYKNLSFAISNDVIFNQLNANTLISAHPQRLSSLTALAFLYKINKLTINGDVLFTAVFNHADTEKSQYLHLSPTIGIAYDFTNFLKFRAFYKNIFRMPTFNDLYYREVGNLNLKPEKTQQYDIGLSFEHPHLIYRTKVSATIDGYFNVVKDKIVAFPNHNLFSWTMLNYGKVYIGGTEINLHADCAIRKGYSLQLWGTCSYQVAVDRTDPKSKTYNQQIPYTPKWSSSAGVGLQLPWLSITYSLIYCGDRYALGQNIPANLVAAYLDQSLTISHEVAVKDAKIGFKFELLNLGDEQYEIIRNYPMPGAGCRLKFYVSY